MGFFERREAIGLCALGLVLCAVLLAGPQQILTGDETRYLIYSLSFWKTGGFATTLPEWQRLFFDANHVGTNELPIGMDGTPLNSVYLPVALSPVASVLSLAGLRLATLIAGLAGLFYLNRLCKRVAHQGTALIVTWITAFTMPLLPYLHLFYMDTFLFALICCGWERLQRADRGPGGDLLTAIVILSMPFVHLRSSVVAAMLFGVLLWQVCRRSLVRRMVTLASLGATAFVALVALNFAIYGALAGPVTTARPPLPSEWFSNTAMQLFNVRHGLLAYAPIWLLGCSGLALGVVRGGTIARQALAFAFIIIVTAVGPNPGECWPARYWVQSVPMLAIGLCIWWETSRPPLLRILTAVLLGFTLLNTTIFIVSPNDFLENRETAATYQALFDRFGGLDFGLILPVEVPDDLNRCASRNLAIGAALFALFVGLAAARRRSFYALPALLLLGAMVDLARVRLLPPTSYAATIETNRISVVLEEPTRAGYVQIGRYWEMWCGWRGRQSFDIYMTAVDQQTEMVQSANQIIPIANADKISRVTIASDDGFDIGSQARYLLRVYRSASMLRRWFPATVETRARVATSRGVSSPTPPSISVAE